MSLELWLPEGVNEEYEITVSGELKTLLAFPFKWFHVDVFNKGDDEVKVMTNAQPLPQAVTLEKNRGREFDAKHPKYWRVALYTEVGKTATVKITTAR